MRYLTPFIALVSIFLAACGEKPSSAENVSTGPKPYPLETCLVSGEELGSMGDPIVIIHEGQEIKFCCDSCQPKFEKEPAKYLALLKKGAPDGQSQDHSGHQH